MVNIKESILNSYCFELEVTDSWQLPAIYKIFKEDTDIKINELCFFSELTDEEYTEFANKILEYNVDKWENNYSLDFNEKSEEEYSWKLTIYYGDNKKIIKRGKDASPDEFADLENFLIEITD